MKNLYRYISIKKKIFNILNFKKYIYYFLALYVSGGCQNFKRPQSPHVLSSTLAKLDISYNIPSNMVAFFRGKNGCPKGWAPYAPAQGRMIVATTQSNLIGKTTGPALKDGKTPGAHNHYFEFELNLAERKSGIISGDGGPLSGNGSYDITFTADKESFLNYPYSQLQVCENKTKSEKDEMPFNSIAFFSSKLCPDNWDIYEYAQNRFILPNPKGGRVGAKTPEEWRASDNVTNHRHIFHARATTGLKGLNTSGGAGNKLTSTHDVSVTLESDHAMVDYDIPFNIPTINLLVCQRTGFQKKKNKYLKNTSLQLPKGMGFFYNGQLCPSDQLTNDQKFSGRFLIAGKEQSPHQEKSLGLKDAMGPGEFVKFHSHSTTTKYQVLNSRSASPSGSHRHYSRTDFSIKSHTVNEDKRKSEYVLPFVALNLCFMSG